MSTLYICKLQRERQTSMTDVKFTHYNIDVQKPI